MDPFDSGHELINRRFRTIGIVLILISTIFFALAGIFTKSTSADPMTIACWRGLVGSIVIAFYVLIRRGRTRRTGTFRLGWRGWALVIIGAVSSLFFIASFKYTYVANVVVIYATVPFMAAALDRLVFGEKTRAQTIVTAAVSLVGVLIIVAGSLNGGQLLGDMFALMMTLGSAIYLVLVRAFRDTPVVWAAAVSAFVVFLSGWIFTDPTAISSDDLFVTILFGFSFAFAVIFWTEGARFLPAAESGLLGAVEVPLAILFAWVILAEAPPLLSVIGGLVILGAVLVHAWRDVRRNSSLVEQIGPGAV